VQARLETVALVLGLRSSQRLAALSYASSQSTLRKQTGTRKSTILLRAECEVPKKTRGKVGGNFKLTA
jgi:hypothetical protein